MCVNRAVSGVGRCSGRGHLVHLLVDWVCVPTRRLQPQQPRVLCVADAVFCLRHTLRTHRRLRRGGQFTVHTANN